MAQNGKTAQPGPVSTDARAALLDRLAEVADTVERRLAERLSATDIPDRLAAAMRHGTLGGGKRFRPFLVIECARLSSGGAVPPDGAVEAAAAIEALHCYSLIHDDLPAMDDDDLRRGQPTVHRAFDDATAILAGDALLTLAFEILSDPATHPDPAARIGLVGILARAGGPAGMVGGQMLDLAAEHAAPDEDTVRRIQSMKTGALITAACAMGAVLGGAAEADRARLSRFGDIIGLAFQLADDLLDVEAVAEDVGKRTGKDADRGKATLVALHGAAWARSRLADLVAEAESLLAPFGPAAEMLREAARFVADRRS